MAGKSLGTLTIDLVAKVGGFVSGLSQAERAPQKWRNQVHADAKARQVRQLSVSASPVTTC